MEVQKVVGKRVDSSAYTTGDGFFFTIYKTLPNVKYVKCTEKGCAVKGKIGLDGLLRFGQDQLLHLHPPDHLRTEVCRLRQELADASKSSPNNPQRIFDTVSGGYVNSANDRVNVSIGMREAHRCAKVSDRRNPLRDRLFLLSSWTVSRARGIGGWILLDTVVYVLPTLGRE